MTRVDNSRYCSEINREWKILTYVFQNFSLSTNLAEIKVNDNVQGNLHVMHYMASEIS